MVGVGDAIDGLGIVENVSYDDGVWIVATTTARIELRESTPARQPEESPRGLSGRGATGDSKP